MQRPPAQLFPGYRFHRHSTPVFARIRTCKHTARCGLDLEFSDGVNVWILCNEAAGVGYEADELCTLIEEAGHTILGVAKQYR